MFTKSFPSPRRFSAYMLTLLLFCVPFSKGAEAQAATPLVTASYAQTLPPPSGLGTVFQTALDSYGDLLFVDYANGGVYEYPVNGGAVITLVPAGGLGGSDNPGIAIGANNDLYIEANYNNCLLRFPYDTATNTWDGLSTVTASNNTAAICPNAGGGTSPYIFAQYNLTVSGAPAYPGYYQPWAITVDSNNNLVITAQNSGNFIFSLGVNGTGSTSTPGTGAMILGAMGARAQSVATDKYGNIYFVEEADTATASPPESPLPGVLMIPEGSTGLTTDAGLTRVDPNLPAVTGVTTDAAGNLYISDSTEGVFFVPNPSGTPETSAAVLLTPLPAYGQVSVDLTRGILYVPTQQNGSEAIAEVVFNAAELGSTATGAPAAASESVLFSFNGAATPGSFVIQEAGAATPDFTIASGGTCAVGTAYAAQSSCTENVTLSPTAAGNVSAKLLMLDASNNILASIDLQGTGTGSALQITPQVASVAPTVIGAGLVTPSQVAVDAGDNTYVADSGLKAVEVYPKGYGAVAAVTTVGTGLTTPTGVAVDGAGDVFIADSGSSGGGSVYEVPAGPNGLNAAGQVTLVSGLGTTNLQLAADGFDDLYISDPENHRVVKLGSIGESFGPLSQMQTNLTGFNAPSAIAVDESGNLYVADGSNLYEVTPAGVQTTLLTDLSNATGLAVDPSGAVYIAMPGGTVRVPDVGGTLGTIPSGTIIAPTFTSPTSVAIDSAQDVYITDAVAEDVDFVSADASINFGTLSTTTSTATANVTVVNDGNAAFDFTAFGSTPDYSETATSCSTSTPEAVGASCTATITFNPGPGDQGTLSGALAVQSGAANSPLVNVTGVGVTLADSTTTVSVTNATVDGAPTVITVAPTSGTGAAPTGQVTLTITGPTLTAPEVVTGTLVSGTSSGAITITPPQLPAGSYTFAVSYQGDRVYGTSTASEAVVVAPGAVTLTQTPLTPSLALAEVGGTWYVLAAGQGAMEPYDGSVTQYEYTYPVQVAATDGVALIGQPVYDSTGTKVVGTNYGTVTYQGAPTPGCQPVSVADDGTAPLSTSCFTINTSNDSIPDLETTYTITPVYSPAGTGANCPVATACPTNPNYAMVTGAPITVTALRNPVVAISSNPSSLTISAGSSATATLTLTSVLGYGIGGANGLLNNYSLPVQLACDGLPAYATCSFSYPTPDPSDPQSVDVGPPAGTVLSTYNAATNSAGPTEACTQAAPGSVGGCFGPGTVIMTINTNISSGVASLPHGQGETIFAAMFGLGLFGFAFSRKKKSLRGSLPTLVCLLACSAIMAGISGCTTKQLGATGTPVSPAGTYTVTVTALEVGSQVIAAPPGITYGNSNQVSLPFTMNVTIQ